MWVANNRPQERCDGGLHLNRLGAICATGQVLTSQGLVMAPPGRSMTLAPVHQYDLWRCTQDAEKDRCLGPCSVCGHCTNQSISVGCSKSLEPTLISITRINVGHIDFQSIPNLYFKISAGNDNCFSRKLMWLIILFYATFVQNHVVVKLCPYRWKSP